MFTLFAGICSASVNFDFLEDLSVKKTVIHDEKHDCMKNTTATAFREEKRLLRRVAEPLRAAGITHNKAWREIG